MLFDRAQSSNFNNKLPLLCKLDISFDGKFLFLYRDSWEARDLDRAQTSAMNSQICLF